MSAPVRVLVLEPAAGGGLAAHVRDELAALREAGWDARRSDARILPRPHPLHDARTVLGLRRAVRRTGIHTIHAHGLRAGALAALAFGRPGRPGQETGPARSGGRRPPRPRLVVTLHNRTVGSRPTRTVGALLLRMIARGADAVLAVSPDLARDARAAGARDVRHAVIPAPAPGLAPGLGASQNANLPGGSDPAASAARSEAPLRVLTVARLAPQKGLDTLLDAVAILAAGAPRMLTVDVAGEGPLRDALEARVRDESLPVRLLGRRRDVPALLADCDLVVSASRWEGQPVFLQEALQAGRAIIATDAGGTRWVTGDAAHLVPVGDAAALAAAILEHRDATVREAAQARSHARARHLPGRADMTRQLLDVLAPAPRPW